MSGRPARKRSFSAKRSYSKKYSKKKGSKSSYKRSMRKAGPKKKRSYKRKAVTEGSGPTIGSYNKRMNVNLWARRELGLLTSTTPGRIMSVSLNINTPLCYSMFIYANTTNVGLINGILPTALNILPPTALVEEVYSKFYSSMVMNNKLTIKFRHTDGNKAYGAVKIAMTPIQYSDYSSVLTAAPSPTTTWVGGTPALKFANQCDFPGTVVRDFTGAASDALNATTISSSVEPQYLYNQPGWQMTPDSAVPSRLGFSEQNGVPIALSCAVVWVVTFFFCNPIITDTSLISCDFEERWKVKAWDAVPAFLVAANAKKRAELVPPPVKGIYYPDETKVGGACAPCLHRKSDFALAGCWCRMRRALPLSRTTRTSSSPAFVWGVPASAPPAAAPPPAALFGPPLCTASDLSRCVVN